MHQMKIAMSIDFDASRCGGKNGRAQIYQRIYQRFLVFPNELRCTLLSLKMLRMSILHKRQFISELPLCSPILDLKKGPPEQAKRRYITRLTFPIF